jgi:hypothetical protein
MKKIALLVLLILSIAVAGCSSKVGTSKSTLFTTQTTSPTTLPNLPPESLASKFVILLSSLPIGYKSLNSSGLNFNPIAGSCGYSQEPTYLTYSSWFLSPGNAGILSEVVEVFQSADEAKTFINSFLATSFLNCLTTAVSGQLTPTGQILSSSVLSQPQSLPNVGSADVEFALQNEVSYSQYGLLLANPNNLPSFNQTQGGINETIEGFSEDKVAVVMAFFYSKTGDGQTLDLTLLAQQLATSALT